MCMPSNHGDVHDITHADFAASPVRPLPPTRPLYRRYRSEPRRQQQQVPQSVPPTAAPPADNAPTAAAPRRVQKTARCTCHNYYAARAMRTTEKRRALAANEIPLTARLLIMLSVAVLASKLIADAMYIASATGAEIGEQRKCVFKRQLPPIEQGNTVIDSIFQIPINTLNAVGTLIKNVRPLVRRTRERIQQYYSMGQQQQYNNRPQQYSNRPQRYTGRQQIYNNDEQNYDNDLQNYREVQHYAVGREVRQVKREPAQTTYIYKNPPNRANILFRPLEDHK